MRRLLVLRLLVLIHGIMFLLGLLLVIVLVFVSGLTRTVILLRAVSSLVMLRLWLVLRIIRRRLNWALMPRISLLWVLLLRSRVRLKRLVKWIISDRSSWIYHSVWSWLVSRHVLMVITVLRLVHIPLRVISIRACTGCWICRRVIARHCYSSRLKRLLLVPRSLVLIRNE